MFKLIAIYAKPLDVDQFTRHLTDVHLPLVADFPKLKGLRYASRINAETAHDGFAVVECEFENEAEMRAALASVAGETASADVPNYAAAGVQIFTYGLTDFPLDKSGA